ncbi:MAG TPA: hypothetical protein VN709_04765 [Terriglobales bacterium]|nr:hypothetical protein [Terriglobales bacterium]
MAKNTFEFDLAKAAAFTPNTDQRRLLNTICDFPSIRTVGELCQASDIGRRTYYNWCNNPYFRLWIATVWSARTLTEGTALINQARARASGHFSYWKALADLTFDPRGLSLLQKWRQAMFSLDSAAFETDDDGPARKTSSPARGRSQNDENDAPLPSVAAVGAPAESGASRAPFSAPSNLLTETSNLRAANELAESFPNPVAVVRHFRRALAPRRRHRSTGLRQARSSKPSAGAALNEAPVGGQRE